MSICRAHYVENVESEAHYCTVLGLFLLIDLFCGLFRYYVVLFRAVNNIVYRSVFDRVC